jgi:hypothetical protein
MEKGMKVLLIAVIRPDCSFVPCTRGSWTPAFSALPLRIKEPYSHCFSTPTEAVLPLEQYSHWLSVAHLASEYCSQGTSVNGQINRPKISLNLLNFSLLKGFVSPSATISSVGTKVTSIFPAST